MDASDHPTAPELCIAEPFNALHREHSAGYLLRTEGDWGGGSSERVSSLP